RAVAVRRVASLLDRLVHRRVLEEREAKALHLRGGVRDLARVPDRIRVGVSAEAPADDRRLERLVAGGQLRHEALERLGLRDGVEAELLVFIGRDLGQRLAPLVTGVRRDRQVELLPSRIGEYAIGTRGPAGIFQELLGLGL